MLSMGNSIIKKITLSLFLILSIVIVISGDSYFSEAYKPSSNAMIGYFNIGEKLYSDGSGELEYYLFVDSENGKKPYNVKFYNNENPLDFSGRFVEVQGEVREAYAGEHKFIKNSDNLDISTIKYSVTHKEFNSAADKSKKTSSTLRAVPSDLKTVAILSKYSGDNTERHAKSYFTGRLFTDSDSHKNYWIDTSYNAITTTPGTIDGTGVVDWQSLPSTRATYGNGDGINEPTRRADVIELADSFIDFDGADDVIQNTGPQIGGPGDNGDDIDHVIMIYNDDFQDGGYAFAFFDPQEIETDEGDLYVYLSHHPDTGNLDIIVENGLGFFAHELGHNLEWRHTPPSFGGDVYADPASLMSGGDSDGVPGVIAHNRDQAGWIPSEDIISMNMAVETDETFTLDILSDPSPGPNYLMGKIHFGIGEYYTVEVRKDTTFDETPLNQFGLWIYHHRSAGHPSSPEPSAPVNIVDTTGTGDLYNADLDLGDSYTANGITIDHVSQTATTITVRVNNNMVESNSDFNNDGYDDIAVGIPGKDLGGIVDAGAISGIYGSASRLSAANSQIWYLGSAGITGNAKAGSGMGEEFGSSISVGDFNGDGYDDIAVGIPGKDLGGIVDAGAISVIYGSASRLSAANSQIWYLGSAGITGNAKAGSGMGEEFGSSISAGDFNGDGYDDIAVGIPGKDLGGIVDAGAISGIYGSASRLSAANSQIWYLGSAGITGNAKAGSGMGEEFGH